MISRLLFISVCIISILNISVTYTKCDVINLTPQKAPNDKWGYIDSDGRYRIKPQFELALPFKEGLAVILLLKKYGYIDEQGKPVIRPQFDDARSFSENLAAVMIYDQNSNKKWGFIDKTGNFIIMPKYDDVSDFSGWVAQVKLNGKTFSINKSGDLVYDALQ